MSPRHLLEIDDLTRDEFADVLARAEDPNPPKVLAGKGVGLIFEKASGRTRNATEMAVVALGGHPVSMRGDEVGIDTRETAEDVVRALAGYHAIVGARVKSHHVLERMAAVSPVPVVNLLSDLSHPCQAIADLLTLKARFGDLAGLRVAFVGDFNNVARSLALASAYTGVDFVVASPPAYAPSALDSDRVAALGGVITVADKAADAVKGADAVYTDVFVSMGQEAEAEARQVAFEGFAVTSALMEQADTRAVFLHCLPAIRGSEVDADVIDGPQSAVFEQAAKRLDAARGALWWLEDNR
ncbi:MAG: ornithine carbamoyltransferase [Actinomycetota bacterium]|jgi:ornithine carbamoyltransferase